MKSEDTTPLREKTLGATTKTSTGQIMPMWIRMPQHGQSCGITGLRRGVLYELARTGKIKTASIRKKTSTRGCRLILLASLLDYISKCCDQPDHVEKDELVEDESTNED